MLTDAELRRWNAAVTLRAAEATGHVLSAEETAALKKASAEPLRVLPVATCATCHFMRNTQCHRGPPSTGGSTIRGSAIMGSWPPVRLDDWCGEYQSKGEFK